MNHYGRLFQLNIYGESHGAECGILLDGVPPGVPLSATDFTADLTRRQSGLPGTTARHEADQVQIKSGLFNGYTTGAPLLISFANKDTVSGDYQQFVNQPRPGHADYTARQKFNGFNDYRGGGHFSGRLTVGIVAAGVIAKKIIPTVSFSTKIASLKGCSEQAQFADIIAKAQDSGDSIGGTVAMTVTGLPVGLGEPFFDSLESTIAHALFAVGGVKGVEFGSGFAGECLTGQEFNDPIIAADGTTSSNHNSGINGGISNGNPLEIKVFVKPTPSISIAQKCYNFATEKVDELTINGRHDTAIILRAQVVLEAMVAIALADAYLINRAYSTNNLSS